MLTERQLELLRTHDSDSKPATIEQLEQLPGSTAEFVVEQLKQHATVLAARLELCNRLQRGIDDLIGTAPAETSTINGHIRPSALDDRSLS